MTREKKKDINGSPPLLLCDFCSLTEEENRIALQKLTTFFEIAAGEGTYYQKRYEGLSKKEKAEKRPRWFSRRARMQEEYWEVAKKLAEKYKEEVARKNRLNK